MARLSVQNRRELLQSFKSSGLTQQAWCQANGVKVSSLSYWLGQERKSCGNATNPNDPQWLTLKVEAAVPNNGASLQSLFVQAGHYSVAVPVGFDAEHLGRVLRTLSGL